MNKAFLWAALAAVAISQWGCSTWRVTGTSRTGVEQLLLSTAADRAIGKMLLASLRDKTVFLDVANLEAVDKAYVVAALKERLGLAGAWVVSESDAEIIVEARAGALATDRFEFMLGLPSLKIPLPSAAFNQISTPEMPLIRKERQTAVAKLALSARMKSSGQLLSATGTRSGTAYFNRWIIFFIPFETTDIPEKKNAD